jgi:rare lipoprotein A
METDTTFSLISQRGHIQFALAFTITLFLITSCSNTPRLGKSAAQSHTNSSIGKKGGGYYLDDGPGDNPPTNLDTIPNAVPRIEPLKAANMRPYVAFGKTYTPMTALKPYKERGQASWYGKRYHGKNTASGEVYNMYAMTAAHPTLPIPSYARVTHLQNGNSVIVRINDRGPFLSNRLIDLSYVAAYKLGILANGSAQVEVESIIPSRMSSTRADTKISHHSPGSTKSTSEGSKVYLQLGAFDSAHNARSYLAQLRTDFPSLMHQSNINEIDGLHKILVGPFTDQISARQTANILSQSALTKPILIQHPHTP